MKREFRAGRWLAALLLMDVTAGTGSQAPTANDVVGANQFYIVSEVTSDASPFWYHYVLQVTPEGRGSRVRYIRIAPLDSMCTRAITVEAATSLLPNASPADLSAEYNVCSVDLGALGRDLRARTHTADVSDSVRFGIVALCGSREAVLHVPYAEQVDLKSAGSKSRELARWWDFERAIKERAFGSSQVFDPTSTEKEEELQREGEAVVPALRAGLFDKGLNPQCPAIAPCPVRPFRDELDGYVGPLGSAVPPPQLLQRAQHRFERYVAPKYPPLAVRAHVSGTVTLDLKVDTGTGAVREAKATDGNPVLRDAALSAARQWQFVPGGTGADESITITLVFEFGCPQPAHGGKPRH